MGIERSFARTLFFHAHFFCPFLYSSNAIVITADLDNPISLAISSKLFNIDSDIVIVSLFFFFSNLQPPLFFLFLI